MFKKLHKHIYLSIILTAILLFVIIIIVSVTMITNSIYKTYVSMAEQKLERSINNCELYINSAMTSTYNLTQDQELISELRSPSNSSLVSKLDDLCNYSLKINAVTIYSYNGETYTSSKVTDVPTLAELKTNKDIDDFIKSSKNSFISIRQEKIAKIYNNSVYPKDYGIISCFHKIYQEDEVLGIIVADILPTNLYSYFNYDNDSYFKNTVTYIVNEDKYLIYKNNESLNSYFQEVNSNFSISKNYKYLLFSKDSSILGSVIIAISLSSLLTRLGLIIGIIILVSILLIITTYITSKKFSNHVINRLDKLLLKMKSIDIDKNI